MSVQDTPSTIGGPPTPRPRPAEDEAGAAPPPWRPVAGTRPTRPRTDYWDVRTASWRSHGPLPRPRAGD